MSERRLMEALQRDKARKLQNQPFTIIRQNGLVHIDAKVDAAFRKALMDGVPVSLRSKMKEALAAVPDKQSAAHSRRYFGAELPAIVNRIAPLMRELNRYLSESRNLPGIYDWMLATGFSEDFRMIKVFNAWAQMKLPVAPKVVNG